METLDSRFNKAVQIIDNQVAEHKRKWKLQQSQIAQIPSHKKIEVYESKIKDLRKRRNILIEAKNTKNDFAIQQYAIQIEKIKSWIIAEELK